MNAVTDPPTVWLDWAGFLRRKGLDSLAAWALDGLAPLNAIGAQLIYAGGPFLRGFASDTKLAALAQLLEDRDETSAFVELLRKGEQA